MKQYIYLVCLSEYNPSLYLRIYRNSYVKFKLLVTCNSDLFECRLVTGDKLASRSAEIVVLNNLTQPLDWLDLLKQVLRD